MFSVCSIGAEAERRPARNRTATAAASVPLFPLSHTTLPPCPSALQHAGTSDYNQLHPTTPQSVWRALEREGWGALPADLLALIFHALLRLMINEQGQPNGATITVGAAAALLVTCSPCRHWRWTALARVRWHMGWSRGDE